MMKKLGIVVMTAFFSVSVAGLSFADEAKKHEAPAAATGAPANPCAGKEMKKEPPKKAKKAGPKVEAPVAAPAAVPAPAAAPAAAPVKK
ncbi:histone [Candidatus Methylomirabilis limnetica]|uniref:Histone n=1 Tax=Candidatus Methylomirabilis limnetica TaxID=2033718 RepID=A0A2T4TWZ0_9BACT|nr:histone [Candidatus Methylomirabilis limnetica]PTL35631.1 histone [Candidatus Methylomirabilis limnetica]